MCTAFKVRRKRAVIATVMLFLRQTSGNPDIHDVACSGNQRLEGGQMRHVPLVKQQQVAQELKGFGRYQTFMGKIRCD